MKMGALCQMFGPVCFQAFVNRPPPSCVLCLPICWRAFLVARHAWGSDFCAL